MILHNPWRYPVDRGPSCDAVERALCRLIRLGSDYRDRGVMEPPIWRGVLVQMKQDLAKLGKED